MIKKKGSIYNKTNFTYDAENVFVETWCLII